jgi:hypothetical protein
MMLQSLKEAPLSRSYSSELLTMQHQQLGILRRAPTHQHPRDRKQLPRHPVHQ